MAAANADAQVARGDDGRDAPDAGEPGALRAALAVWSVRLRVLGAVAIIWGVLFLVLNQGLLPTGIRRPATLLVGHGGPLAAIAILVVVACGAAVAGLMVPRRDPQTVMVVIGLALGLWAMGRGNMDDWLIAQNPAPGPARGAAYWPLLAEYALMVLLLAAAAVISIIVCREGGDGMERRTDAGGSDSRAAAAGPTSPAGRAVVARLFGGDRGAWRDGLLALLTTSAVGAAGLILLSGPLVGRTLRGQVYFAILVGFVLGVIAARQYFRRAAPGWFWAAPLLTGAAGVLYSVAFPAKLLGDEYGLLNTLPAIGLVRPLPVELLGVGLVAVGWGLHIVAGREAQGTGRR